MSNFAQTVLFTPHSSSALHNTSQQASSNARTQDVRLVHKPLQESVVRALGQNIIPGTRWTVIIKYEGHFDVNANFLTKDYAMGHRIPRASPKYVFFCSQGNGEQYRLANSWLGELTAERVLLFVDLSILQPLPPNEPCIPNEIHFSVEVLPFYLELQHFFSNFPAPFMWQIDKPLDIQKKHLLTNTLFEEGMERARVLKNAGNAAYRTGEQLKAADAFHEAGNRVKDLLEQDLQPSDVVTARRFLAVCYANRALVWLLPGKMDLKRCIEDALKAEESDPSYSKSYIRQARGYQGLGEFDKAMDTLARALSRDTLMHDSDLVQSLIVLQTDGKGLPDNEEEMAEFKRRILTGDVASVKRMKEVPINGAWYLKIAEHLTASKPME